jgi:riboflavin kinase/FMN adenylyltransferase
VATELIRGLSSLPPAFPGCVVTIGNFDGVHRGHQALLAQVIDKAQALNVPSVVVIFEPQPAEFFANDSAVFPRLTRLSEKFDALADCGIDKVLVLDFNHDLANLTADEFIQQILCDSLHVKHVFIGDDFRFGKGRVGDWTFLKNAAQRLGFTVAQMPSILIDGERVSSTQVRKALAAGNHVLADKLLGHAYTMKGLIVHGDKLGRKLGFPTANIDLERIASPVQGVYVVRMHGIAAKPLPGVANIGTRPTIAEGLRNLLEVYLFDFDQDIYGREVSIEFCVKLRDEIRYENVVLLQQQIAKDVDEAREYFMQRGELQSSSHNE